MSSFGVRLTASVKDKWLMVFFVCALVVLGLNIGLIAWRLPGLGAEHETLTLHYNVFFGVDWVGPWWLGYGIPVFGFCVLVLNSILAVIVHPTEWFVSRVLVAMAGVVNVLLLFAALFFILANL